MKDMRQIVEEEMEGYRTKYGELYMIKYFNNFTANLPCGLYRTLRLDLDYSEEGVLMGQTSREFFGVVDRVIEEAGIDVSAIESLQECEEGYEKLCELVLPVFVRLREMGYAHSDLRR